MTSDVRFHCETDAAVATVRFDHAPTRNALDRETRARLVEVLEELDEDPGIRAIVITGTDPSFTSGVDAKQLLGDPHYAPLPVDPATRLRELATPTIAAVNGSCVSGGLEIALACSMIVASDRARFADTHVALGLTPGWGLSSELPAAIGVWRARQMSLTALPIDAATAYEWGLVNEVVEHERLPPRARELASAIGRIDADSAANSVRLYAKRQHALLAEARQIERATLEEWTVDRSAAGDSFAQRVSPPST